MRFLQWKQVFDGTKTQTRRLVKYGEVPRVLEPIGGRIIEVRIIDPSSWTPAPPAYLWTSTALAVQISKLRWAVGKTYAVQRPDGKTVGRTPPIREIRQERLGDISYADCLREGIARLVITHNLIQSDGSVREHRSLVHDCPVCSERTRDAVKAFACLWNHCGNWERDKDEQVFVLDWGER